MKWHGLSAGKSPTDEFLKPKLLVVELWGLGDLVIATPFLQAASERHAVTILAKPYASDLQARQLSLWQLWDSKLPNNTFVQRHLESVGRVRVRYTRKLSPFPFTPVSETRMSVKGGQPPAGAPTN